jgi:hypothetical protein
MDFMTVAAIVVGIGTLAGVAMGVIKMIREMEYEDEYYHIADRVRELIAIMSEYAEKM